MSTSTDPDVESFLLLLAARRSPRTVDAYRRDLAAFGATIDTPSNLTAAQHLEQWVKNGYFPADVNAIDYATAMSRFIGGQGLFLFNGDWESGNLDKQMTGKAGFFVMPPAEAGGKHAAMSAPLTYGIGAKYSF